MATAYSTMNKGGEIESRKDYDHTRTGQYTYYSEELGSSRTMLMKWHKMGDRIVNRYLGKRSNSTRLERAQFDLNLFHSNVTTLASMLYGNTPKIDVSRRYADPDDDVARVAATTLERLLNLDVQENGAEIDSVFKAVLNDRLIPGLGCARVRYDFKSTATGFEESAPIEYYFWGDVLWSWARNFTEVRWVAFRNYLTKDEVEKRFGRHAAENVPLKQQKMASTDESERDPQTDGAWKKAEIWEIWDKTTRKVSWLCFGYHRILDERDDPLRLNGFFPIPPFFMANPTSSLYIPCPDFKLAEDLYNEIDKLQERISIITEAVKVVGVYDASSEEVKQMFRQGVDNDLIPVSNWALFGEKNGLKGQIDWVPIADIVNALDKLRELRSDAIGLLQQITGMSDIMRGELDSAYEGVGQSQMKAKFGSIRVQALQDEFAKFASDVMQLKAEIIAKHFSPETIAERSNMRFSVDRELLPAAIELIKNPAKAKLRAVIRPESVAMVDYAQLKAERTDFINALATYMQSAGPLIEQDPAAKPFLLQLLQWGLAGFKGASEIEGVLDRAIKASEDAAKETAPEDPAAVAARAAMQQEQLKQQGELAKIQAKAEADVHIRQNDMQADVQTAVEAHRMKMAEIQAQAQAKLAEIQAKMEADITVEQIQSQANILQARAQANAETDKDTIGAQLEVQKEAAKSALKIQEIAESSKAKIDEMKAKPETSKNDDDE